MDDNDNIIEPGEKGKVINYTIKNFGDMPSPLHSDL